MHITLADIEGMASPGWGEGSVEIPDLDLLDDLDGEAASSGSGERKPLGCIDSTEYSIWMCNMH